MNIFKILLVIILIIPMTNEFSGHIARRLCRIAALEHEKHMNNYALRVLPCSATNPTRTLCTRKPIRHGYILSWAGCA